MNKQEEIKYRGVILVVLLVVGMALACWRGADTAAQTPEPYNAPLEPRLLIQKINSGEVTMTPGQAAAGAVGAWTVTYQVGEIPIKTGGGIWVNCLKLFMTAFKIQRFLFKPPVLPFRTGFELIPQHLTYLCRPPSSLKQTRRS